MIELKVSLSLSVPGAGMLSSQECEENPQESYDENKLVLTYIKGKGKYQKEVKRILTYSTRKQKLVTQNINLCKEAYDYMLDTPTSAKFSKIVKTTKRGKQVTLWSTLSVDERLKHHFDLIAHDFHAVSYSYKILDD